MTIRRHPRDETLLEYAAGTLVSALSAVVACHLTFCPRCRAEVARMERIGGALLGGMKGEVIALPALERAVAASQAIPGGGDEPPAPPAPDGVLPRPLARYLGMGIGDVPWKKVGPGVRQFKVKLPSRGGDLRLLSVKPGVALLHHGHYGSELTLVLAGAYRDETGEYHAGEVADLDEETEHLPRAIGAEPCICIIAGETHPRYSSLKMRMLRPFLGF
jgi:putative transcriptional regulator